MEIFRVARRLRPRREYKVSVYDEVTEAPIRPSSKAIAVPLGPAISRRGAFTALGGVGLLLVLLIQFDLFGPGEEDPGPRVAPPRPTPSATVLPGTIKARQAEQLAIGGGGGGGGGAPPVPSDPGEALMRKARKIVFRLRTSPTTPENIEERMKMFEHVFKSLDPTDRVAMFGVVDFRLLEATIRSYKGRAPQAVDRMLTQLRLILF